MSPESGSAYFTFEVVGLSTPLAVTGFRGTEGMSKLFEFEIDLSSEDGGLAFDDVLGKPALLARMEIVPFLTLAPEFLSDIVKLKLRKIEGRLRDSHKMKLEFDPRMIEVITNRCTEVETGARNIDHIINQTLLPMLSSALLERMTQGPLPGAVRMTVGEDEGFRVEFVEAASGSKTA